MLSGGKIGGAHCVGTWNENTVARTDINGDGLIDEIRTGFCSGHPEPAANDFFVFLEGEKGSLYRSADLPNPKNILVRRFHQYAGTASPPDTTLYPDPRRHELQFTVGDLVELPDGTFENISHFSYDVDTRGQVHSALAVYYDSQEQSVPLSQLKRISSLDDEARKGEATLLAQIRKTYARELVEVHQILSYADLQNLKKAPRARVIELVREIREAVKAKISAEIRGNMTRDKAEENILTGLGFSYEEWFTESRCVTTR